MKSSAILPFAVALIIQISNTSPTSALPAVQDSPLGKVKDNTGVGSGFRPAPGHPGVSAYIPLHHIRQEPFLCVTTSATMVLAYYGVMTSPRELKARSDGRAYRPGEVFHYNRFTYFYQLLQGVASLGCSWRFNSFPLTEEGFKTGLSQVKAALDHGKPPLVDTSLYGDHTIVICGYDEATARILIMDPNISDPGLRALTYAQFEKVWNSDGVRYHYRAAVFTSGRPEGRSTAAR
jgi:Peptidase_C39 like family